jgi:hypothetical protein
MRWDVWRRDCYAGLVGAIVAAGVLVPLDWRQLDAERRQANERARVVAEQGEAVRKLAGANRAALDRLMRDVEASIGQANIATVAEQAEQLMRALSYARATPPAQH